MERPIGVARARPRAAADRDDSRAIVVASRAMGASQPSFARQHQIALLQRQNPGFRAWRAVQHSRGRRNRRAPPPPKDFFRLERDAALVRQVGELWIEQRVSFTSFGMAHR